MGETSPNRRRSSAALKKGTAEFVLRFGGEDFHLLPDRALFWPRESVLVLSDVHLGKAETLQGLGIPIPAGDHLVDLDRIAVLLRATHATRVVILGDLIHQKRGLTDELLDLLHRFLSFMSSVDFTLILGNHERGAAEILSELPMRVLREDLRIGAVNFSHGHEHEEEEGPSGDESLLTVQGHLHPVTTLKDGSTKLRLPCFWLSGNRLVLPSFGVLTGGMEIKPGRKDRVFVAAGDHVFEKGGGQSS